MDRRRADRPASRRRRSKLARIREEIDRINAQIRSSTEDFDVDLPQIPDLPETVLPGGGLRPLISTAWSWAENTRELIPKRYANAGGANERARARPRPGAALPHPARRGGDRLHLSRPRPTPSRSRIPITSPG